MKGFYFSAFCISSLLLVVPVAAEQSAYVRRGRPQQYQIQARDFSTCEETLRARLKSKPRQKIVHTDSSQVVLGEWSMSGEGSAIYGRPDLLSTPPMHPIDDLQPGQTYLFRFNATVIIGYRHEYKVGRMMGQYFGEDEEGRILLHHDDYAYAVPKTDLRHLVFPIFHADTEHEVKVHESYTFVTQDRKQFFYGRLEGYDDDGNPVLMNQDGVLFKLNHRQLLLKAIHKGKSIPEFHFYGLARDSPFYNSKNYVALKPKANPQVIFVFEVLSFTDSGKMIVGLLQNGIGNVYKPKHASVDVPFTSYDGEDGTVFYGHRYIIGREEIHSYSPVDYKYGDSAEEKTYYVKRWFRWSRVAYGF